jgi:hypothetical protein
MTIIDAVRSRSATRPPCHGATGRAPAPNLRCLVPCLGENTWAARVGDNADLTTVRAAKQCVIQHHSHGPRCAAGEEAGFHRGIAARHDQLCAHLDIAETHEVHADNQATGFTEQGI